MYILYYFNQNYQIQTIEVDTLDAPILIPENLIFINLRKGINFIKEPHKCIDFTHLERLIMASEFTDTEIIKEGDFRKANTYLSPLCEIDVVPDLLAVAPLEYFTSEGEIRLRFQFNYQPLGNYKILYSNDGITYLEHIPSYPASNPYTNGESEAVGNANGASSNWMYIKIQDMTTMITSKVYTDIPLVS